MGFSLVHVRQKEPSSALRRSGRVEFLEKKRDSPMTISCVEIMLDWFGFP
jgi:hypothetical protein